MKKPSKVDIERELIWRRCIKDPHWFLENYWSINQVGKGYATSGLWPHQDEMVSHMLEAFDGGGRNVYLKARQIGFTTLAMGLAFWSGFFHDDHPWLITSQGESEAADTLSTKLKQPYERLPAWMRKRGPTQTKDTGEEFGFDNGSRFLAIPSTSRSGRSKAVYGVLMDEAAFQMEADELFAALDPLCYGPLFMFSTANGMSGMFHQNWLDSQLPGSEWSSLFFPWDVVPGRDDEWYARQTRKYRATPHLLAQEYPKDATEAFLKSGRVAFDVGFMEETQPFVEPGWRYDLSIFDHTDSHHALLGDGAEADLELHVWEQPTVLRDENGVPIQKPNYTLGSDVSEGLLHGDFSAGSVMDANTQTQVATWKTHVPIYDLGRMLEQIGYWYHTALIVSERNAMGITPLVYLQEQQYPRLYRMESFAQIKSGDRTARYGWYTSRQSKPKMVQDMAMYLNDEQIILQDPRFLVEASTFINDGKGQFNAKAPNHDDLLMGTMMALQGSIDVGEYPVVWVDDTLGPLTLGDLLGTIDEMDELPSPLHKPIGDSSHEAASKVRSFMVNAGG